MEQITDFILSPEVITTALVFLYESIARKRATKKSYSLLTLIGRLIHGYLPDKAKNGGYHK